MEIVSSEREITFDDVLLLPNRSESLIGQDAEVELRSRVSRDVYLDVPIVSAPMPGVSESRMAIALGKRGGLGFIHFFQSFERQLEQVREVKRNSLRVAASVADLGEGGLKHVDDLVNAGVDLISIESPHAHNGPTISFLRQIKKKHRHVQVSVALVATGDAAQELIDSGADSIRVGIGGGSHCTTRLVTGVGRPQLGALKDCYSVTQKHGIPLISDTGIKYAGDIPKALAFGAETVMIGGLFAGAEECPGEIVIKGGKKYKRSWGMCTRAARDLKQPLVASTSAQDVFFEEGVEGLIPYQGSVEVVLDHLIAGLQRSMWYQGAKNVKELQRRARVVLVSPSTHLENMARI